MKSTSLVAQALVVAAWPHGLSAESDFGGDCHCNVVAQAIYGNSGYTGSYQTRAVGHHYSVCATLRERVGAHRCVS